MTIAFRLFQTFLLMCGVFGEDQEKTVSVMEGGSVTLNPDLTKIQGFIQILWKFRDNVPDIARMYKNATSYKYGGIFRDRLQLNQTGFLTIKNMRTEHSGLYKAEIDDREEGQSVVKFLVTVYESPSVLDAGEAEMKSVSVKEGESVTLHTDVTELHGDELIVWRFGGEGKLIAKSDLQNKSSTLYITDERFRDRLQLNDQTGSLTINNMKNTDSGLYRVKISSSKQMINKRFIVTVSERGQSPGATAGIVVLVLLFIAAAAAGVIYYLKISAPKKKTLYVTDGESVTLETDFKIQRGDEIQWMFGDCVIAGIKGKNRETYTYDDPDERFKGRLELRKISGCLTIRNIRTKHAGEYTLKIRGRRVKIFSVKISEMKAISETEGYSVTLNTDTTINKDVRMLWLFGDSLIAETKRGTGEIIRYDDKRFRERLKLDETTGDLTITDIRAEHAGLYKLQIISDEGAKNKGFCVSVSERRIPVKEGNSVSLETHVEIQKDDQILWTFGVEKSLIAQIKEGKLTCIDERFRCRLKLNEETGDLTVTDITPEHTGLYEVQIFSNRRTLCRRFNVVMDEFSRVTEGDSVTLKTDLTEIQENSHIVWRFRDHDCPIAEIKGGAATYHEGPDGRFRYRLMLDKMTGSLTIRSTTYEHDGDYKLQIISDEEETSKIFCVTVMTRLFPEEIWSMRMGHPITLKTGLTEIQENSHIVWRFRDHDSPIAEIKGGTATNHEGPDGRFRDRLKLDETTGDLTITCTKAKNCGDYKLQIISDKGQTIKGFRVEKSGEETWFVTVGDSVTINPHLPEIQKNSHIVWRFGDHDCLIAEVKGGTATYHEGPDGRFRDRLKLDKTTGSLTITNATDEHDGDYILKIISDEEETIKVLRVEVRTRKMAEEERRRRFPFFDGMFRSMQEREKFKWVTEGHPVTLKTGLTEIQKNSHIVWRFRDYDCLIAEVKGGTATYHEGPDGRFRDRLKLDETTGDLTITSTKAKHDGDYELKIISDEGKAIKKFCVKVMFTSMLVRTRSIELEWGVESVTVTEGHPVTLKTGLTEIQENRHIVWRFGVHDSPIAEIKGGAPTYHEGPDGRFRDRLKLDETTGDLTITNTTYEHYEDYKLKIISDEEETIKRFCIDMIKFMEEGREEEVDSWTEEEEEEEEMFRLMGEEAEGKRENESVAVEMPLLNEVPDGVNEEGTSSL